MQIGFLIAARNRKGEIPSSPRCTGPEGHGLIKNGQSLLAFSVVKAVYSAFQLKFTNELVVGWSEGRDGMP